VDDNERIRVMESNLDRMIGWVGSHDGKASFLLGIATALLAVLANDFVRAEEAGGLARLFAVLPILPIGLVFVFLFRGAYPRTKVERTAHQPSLIFFGTLAGLRSDQLRERVAGLDSTAYLRDLCDQCVEVAAIVDAKFKALERAYLFLFISLPLWLLSTIYLRSTR
jgi:hypothetical protein